MNQNEITTAEAEALDLSDLTPLGALVEPLEDLEFLTTLHRVETDGMIELLRVELDGAPEQEELSFTLEVIILNDLMQALGDEDEEEEAIIFQFSLVMPYVFPVESYLEVMRLCGIVNRLLPLGAFGLAEADEAVYLRYCLASPTRYLDETVLIEVVQAIEFACREYGPHFDRASQGQPAATEFIAKFEESGHFIPSVGNPRALRGPLPAEDSDEG